MDICRVSVHQNTSLLWGVEWLEGMGGGSQEANCLEQGWETWLVGSIKAWTYESGCVVEGGGSVDCSPLPDQCPCPQLWGHAQG